MSTNILVTCFSETGNTKKIGMEIAKMTEADFYEIKAKHAYSQEDLDWTNRQSRTSVEMNDPSARPEIAQGNLDLSQYDLIFLGSPLWWGENPRIIASFLEDNDFAGKKIIPFVSSGSSPLGNNEEKLRRLAPKAEWLPGKRFGRFHKNEVDAWLADVL